MAAVAVAVAAELAGGMAGEGKRRFLGSGAVESGGWGWSMMGFRTHLGLLAVEKPPRGHGEGRDKYHLTERFRSMELMSGCVEEQLIMLTERI